MVYSSIASPTPSVDFFNLQVSVGRPMAIAKKPRKALQVRAKRGARVDASAVLRQSTGKNLRALRDVLGLAQKEFGSRAGLAPNTYNMIENGAKLPSVPVAIAICDAHGVTLDYIYRGDASDLAAPIRRALEAITIARSGNRDG
jgi:DNA-binding XRE family transcriptional regulator